MNEVVPHHDDPGATIRHDIFTNPGQLLSYYDTNVVDLATLKSRVWTQIQHYTWLLSVVLGAGPAAVISSRSSIPGERVVLTSFAVVGTVMAMLAFWIIGRDLQYMANLDAKILYIEKALGVPRHPGILDRRLEVALAPTFTVQQASKPQREDSIWPHRWRIRTLIRSSFILYAILGIVEVVFFLVLDSALA
jgi:hypothetical protein